MIQTILTPAALLAATTLAVLVGRAPELPPVGPDAERPAKRVGERPRAPRLAAPTVVALENGDPFRAYEQTAASRRGAVVPASLEFLGTMGSGERRSAIIGDKRYRAGDALGDGGVILEVHESRVVWRDERGETQEMRLKQQPGR